MNLFTSLSIFVIEVVIVTVILILFLKRQLKSLEQLEYEKIVAKKRKQEIDLYLLSMPPSEELASSRGFVSSLKKNEALIGEFNNSIGDKEIIEKNFRKIIYEYPKKFITLTDV